MQRVFDFFRNKIYENLIRPIITSKAPVHETALGTAIGVFVGLTPTVGIQMWIVLMIWLFCRYVLRFRFELVIGTALVWISNPFTMLFLYYGFWVTGDGFFSLIGVSTAELSYAAFQLQFSQIVNNPGSGYIKASIECTKFLVYDLGYPLMLGSLFYAFPFSLASYLFIRKFLHTHRLKIAKRKGLDYETWREKHVRMHK